MHTTGPWPRRPAPFGDESFLSWFTRVALANCITPSELYRLALPGGHMYFADLDRHYSPQLLAGLEEGTKVPSDDIRSLTFDQWVGTLIGDDDGRGALNWLPPVGNRRRIQSYGQQICPRCLAEDEMPYLRASWRVAFYTVCPAHGCLLIDRCPDCGAVIYPLNLVGPGKQVSMCWNCGFDLRRAVANALTDMPTGPLDETLAIALEYGWTELNPGKPIHALLYFRLLWLVYRLLATGRRAYPLRDHVCENHGLNIQGRAIPALRETDKLNSRQRHALMRMTLALLEEWPDRFVIACEELGIRSRHVFKDRREEPFAIVDPVDAIPYGTPAMANRLHLEEIKKHLAGRNVRPTQRALRSLSGRKPRSLPQVAEPALEHVPYGQSRYWKLDGVSPEVRRLAKEAAKLEGEKIAAWVEKTIMTAITGKEVRIVSSIQCKHKKTQS